MKACRLVLTVSFRQLQSYPAFYEGHVEYIKLLRGAGMLGDLRHAHVKMAEQFPLTPELWRPWLRDEARLAASAADVERVAALFESAVGDYLGESHFHELICSLSLLIHHSLIPLLLTFAPTKHQDANIWLDYAAFLREQLSDFPAVVSIARVSDVYERAAAVAGLNPRDAAPLWVAYCEFEQLASGDAEAEVPRIRRLFLRGLRVPMQGADRLFEAYAAWEIVNDEAASHAHIKAAEAVVERAIREREARQALEDALVRHAHNCLS